MTATTAFTPTVALPLPRRLPAMAKSLLRLALDAAAHRRQMRALALLEGHLLADVGLTKSDVVRAQDKTIWDAPTHWSA